MKKFAAHYLLTHSGLLLKNGIAVYDDNGSFQFIDTNDELTELEQMIFHSGLLLGAFEFLKRAELATEAIHTKDLPPLFDPVINSEHLSLKQVMELARQLQDLFPGRNIPFLLQQTEQVLLSQAFVKNTIPQLYLLSGLDLENLRFTPRTKLKRVL